MIRPLPLIFALSFAGAALAAPDAVVIQTSGTYKVQVPADLRGIRGASDVRLLPVGDGDAITGVRLSAVAADSLAARAGLREGDIIRGIDNRPIDSLEAAIAALQAGVDGGRLFLHVERDGQRLAMTYLVEKVERPAAGQGRGPNPDTAAPPAAVDWIRPDGPGAWRVTRSGLDAALAEPSALARSARIIPAREGDAFVGFKLYGVRPQSIVAALGLKNGDLLRTVNGLPLATPQQALEAYTALRNAPSFALELTRGGAPLTLRYTIEGAPTAPSPKPGSTP